MKRMFWRCLVQSLAIAFAARLLGVFGAVLVGALALGLWRWPRAQIISASAIAFLCFVGIMLLMPGHQTSAMPAAVASATRPPSQKNPWEEKYVATSAADSAPDTPPSGGSAGNEAAWNRDVANFEAAHPDLNDGQNMTIMQDKINEINNPTFTNPALLQEAYEIAVLDPQWDKAAPAKSTKPAPLTYLQSVMESANDCQRRGGNVADCYVKASPKRCTQMALTFIGSAGSNAFDLNRRQWAVCVNSCQAASALSKLVGDCRR